MGRASPGEAYLPALSDVIIMVEKTSYMGLGGPNLVKGAIGKSVDAETLGGATTHTEASGVAHHRARDDQHCLEIIRQMVGELPRPNEPQPHDPSAPLLDEREIYSVLPADHRLPYDLQEIVLRIFDREGFLEFMADYAPEVLCANARLAGRPVGLIANRRGVLRQGESTRLGAIIYTESARKIAQFVETCDRHDHPLVYLQDVSGFMVGPEAEESGIIRAGAEMVETMACARVPKIVVTLSHASGAGYYAMAGQGFDPNFIFTLAHGKSRRHGRRVGPSRPFMLRSWSGSAKLTSRPVRSCKKPWIRPVPTMKEALTRNGGRLAATLMRSSTLATHARYSIYA